MYQLLSARGQVDGQTDHRARFAVIEYDNNRGQFVYYARRWHVVSSYICQLQGLFNDDKKYFRLWPIYIDCDQSDYSSRIVFSYIFIEFGQTGIGAILSADLENLTVEPNMKWIGRPLAEIWPFEISPIWAKWEVGRSLVGPQYILLLTLFSYTPLRYVRNVAREE